MMLDILEEHLEEVSWLYDVRAGLLRSYHVTLADLAEWDERWAAHVDGLVVGGDAALPLLEQGLAAGDEGAVCAAAAALACRAGAAGRRRIEASLEDPGRAAGGAVLLGLGLAPDEAHEAWLGDWIRAASPALRAAALEVMRFRGLAASPETLRPLFRAAEQPPEVIRAALALVADLKVAGCNACVEAAMTHPDAGVRSAAAEAAVRIGLRGARETWRSAVRGAARSAAPDDLEKLGLFGAPEDLPVLTAAVQDRQRAAAALRGLAWLGHPGAADPLIAAMTDGATGRLAAHAFSILFGPDVEKDGLVAAPVPAPEDETLESDPFEGLPAPDPAAVARWWKANGARFLRGTRWRGGRPFEPASAAVTLRDGRLADRRPAALELAFNDKSIPALETAALAPRQRRWLGERLGH
jgi:uncharacterized protein (TIGR02270 family)